MQYAQRSNVSTRSRKPFEHRVTSCAAHGPSIGAFNNLHRLGAAKLLRCSSTPSSAFTWTSIAPSVEDLLTYWGLGKTYFEDLRRSLRNTCFVWRSPPSDPVLSSNNRKVGKVPVLNDSYRCRTSQSSHNKFLQYAAVPRWSRWSCGPGRSNARLQGVAASLAADWSQFREIQVRTTFALKKYP